VVSSKSWDPNICNLRGHAFTDCLHYRGDHWSVVAFLHADSRNPQVLTVLLRFEGIKPSAETAPTHLARCSLQTNTSNHRVATRHGAQAPFAVRTSLPGIGCRAAYIKLAVHWETLVVIELRVYTTLEFPHPRPVPLKYKKFKEG
jgi:hypothetical protein